VDLGLHPLSDAGRCICSASSEPGCIQMQLFHYSNTAFVSMSGQGWVSAHAIRCMIFVCCQQCKLYVCTLCMIIWIIRSPQIAQALYLCLYITSEHQMQRWGAHLRIGGIQRLSPFSRSHIRANTHNKCIHASMKLANWKPMLYVAALHLAPTGTPPPPPRKLHHGLTAGNCL